MATGIVQECRLWSECPVPCRWLSVLVCAITGFAVWAANVTPPAPHNNNNSTGTDNSAGVTTKLPVDMQPGDVTDSHANISSNTTVLARHSHKKLVDAANNLSGTLYDAAKATLGSKITNA